MSVKNARLSSLQDKLEAEAIKIDSEVKSEKENEKVVRIIKKKSK